MRVSKVAPMALAAIVSVSCTIYAQPGAPGQPPPPYDQGGPGMNTPPPPDYNAPPPPDQGGAYPPPGGAYPAPGGPGGPGDQGDPGYPPGGPQGADQAGYPQDQGDAGYAPDQGDDQASAPDINQFYTQLSPYGEWVQNPQYGWVWSPRNVTPGWRPYTEGHWVYTDAGWAWDDDEPWGWAPFHYGRWFFDASTGWGWVPGNVWAPAWVAWQSGGGYIGWAALPPRVGWRVGFGLELGGLDLRTEIGPASYCFVRERDILAPRVRGYIEPFGRNVTIIRNTVNITNYSVVGRRVVNRGVAVAHVEQVTGRHIEPLHLTTGAGRAPARARVQSGQIAFYRPPVQARGAVAGRPGRPGEAVGMARPPERAQNETPDQLAARHQREQHALDQFHQGQQQRLQQMHQQELAGQQQQQARQQVTQRHAEEMQAMQQQQVRERQALQGRQQQERQRSQAPARPQEHQEHRPPGR